MLARLAARRLARGQGEGPDAAAPRRRLARERAGIRVPPRQLVRYLAATDGERIARFAAPDGVLPPIVPVLWEAPLCAELLAQVDGIPIAGLVHLEGESVLIRPLRPGDRIRCRVEMEGMEGMEGGVHLRIRTRSWNGAGQLCAESTATFLARSKPGGAGNPSARRRENGATSDGIEWTEIGRWTLRGSAGRRYARASGDYNPIHLWSWTARPFGFRRPILHGFCLEAMVAHALIEHRWGGNPTALRRIDIRFRSPLGLPATPCLLVSEGKGAGAFRVVEAGEDGRTIAEGEFAGG
jgi:acyl dehydratase